MLLFFLIKWRFLKEELRVNRQFYSDKAFRAVDRALLKAYFFENPYRASRKFYQKMGAQDPYVYGETPLTTFEVIGREIALTADDYVIDLGSGRGRGVFFLAYRFGCHAHGIEWNDKFVVVSENIRKYFGVLRTSFSHENMLGSLQLESEATVIYLYGICFDDAEVRKLIPLLSQAKSGTKIVTVSESLVEYAPELFSLKKKFEVTYPWGKTDAYLHLRI